MNAQLNLFSLMMCEDSPKRIGSAESADGLTPAVSPDGPTTVPSGPAPAHVSRSRSRAREEVPTTSGICGPTSFASSVPSGPLAYLESKLRERLAMVGSTECALIWREKVTPAGASISRLAPWTPRIDAAASTGSPKLWPTPVVPNGGRSPKGGRMSSTGQTPEGKKRQVDLNWIAQHWATPTARDWPSGEASEATMKRNARPLNEQVVNLVAHWPTPRVSNNGGIGNGTPERTAKACLEDTVAGTAHWVSPIAEDGRRGSLPPRPWDTGIPLSRQVVTVPSGPMPNGSPGRTESRGALGSEFVAWIMGYPLEWIACAPRKKPQPLSISSRTVNRRASAS
jgi:hypothetical protein